MMTMRKQKTPNNVIWSRNPILPLSGFQATSCCTPSDAIHKLLRFLYLGQPPPDHPLSGKTPKQEQRNTQVWREHADGMSYSELAAKYEITSQRISQIIHGRRK
jgi:hypothetical protein